MIIGANSVSFFFLVKEVEIIVAFTHLDLNKVLDSLQSMGSQAFSQTEFSHSVTNPTRVLMGPKPVYTTY